MSFLSSFYPQPVVPNAIEVTASGSDTARTLSDRFAERVNILDFGADPTGATSSRTALINAIAAAPSGGAVYLPKGIYSGIYEIEINKPISIFGESPEQSIINTADQGDRTFKLITNCTLFSISDITIQWTGGWTGTGYSRGVQAISGVSDQLEVYLNRVHMKNIGECVSLWQAKVKKLDIRNSKFTYLHGSAGIRSAFLNCTLEQQAVGACASPCMVLGQGKYTYIYNNEFNGLLDPTFTGVSPSAPLFMHQPPDNVFKGAGTFYHECFIENNFFKNYGIEGIIIERVPLVGSYETPTDEWFGFYSRVCNNVLIGPEKKTNFFRGVNLAIEVFDPHKADICNNFIADSVTAIAARRRQPTLSANASNNTITITYSTVQPTAYPSTTNGSTVRFTFKSGGNPTGIELDRLYYVVEATELSGNSRTFKISETLNGSPVSLGTNASANSFFIIADKHYNKESINISNNYVTNCINGVVLSNFHEDLVIVANNKFDLSSEPVKSVHGFADYEINNPPLNYNDLVPFSISTGGATIKNNNVKIADPAWDGVFDLVSRSGDFNATFLLGSGQAEEIFDSLESINGNVLYGSLMSISPIGVFYLPIGNPARYFSQEAGMSSDVFILANNVGTSGNSIELSFNGSTTISASISAWNASNPTNQATLAFGDGTQIPNSGETISLAGGGTIDVENNTVTIDFGWANSASAVTNGKLYWTKTNGVPWLSALRAANNGGRNIYYQDNTVFGAAIDVITSTGPVSVFSSKNSFIDLRGAFSTDSNVRRQTSFDALQLLQGTGAPSVTAPNGSLYLRTDGDSSTTMYVRAGGAWKPLSSWNP